MNSPIEKIRREYILRPEDHSFEWYVNWHIERGFVFSTPDFFIMGFAVDSMRLRQGLQPIDCHNPAGDCWYLFAMAGSMSKAWSIMPWELPFLAWHRDRDGGKDLQIWPMGRIKRLTRGNTL
jgi:hypothetical protein